MPKFNEDNTTEQMLLATLQRNGWEYIPAEDLDRDESDVMVESMVRSALIRLNPEIAQDESRADEVIYRLRTLFLSTNAQNLVTQNEAFKELVFEKNSYPFGENGRQVSIDLFGTEVNGKLDQNQYVVTNQWVYPKKKGGNGVKNINTPVIVERVVTDIDDIVKIVRFDGWQNTTAGRQEVKKALRSVVWVKYKIKDKEVFDKAYSYIEQYY